MKNILVVTGGAGFVGSNLINYLIKKTNHKIISIDNYSSGSKKNHIKNSRIKYFSSHTKNISQILKKPKNINPNSIPMTDMAAFPSHSQDAVLLIFFNP